MIKRADGTLHYSPSDLTVWLEGEFAAWMERYHVERDKVSSDINARYAHLDRDADDPELELRARKGDEHEQRYLASLRAAGRQVVEIARGDDSAARTLEVMRSGAEVIYQGHLDDGTLHGFSDFLIRVDGDSSLGAFHYEAWDTKLARTARPYFLVQLCAYAELLEGIQGKRPAALKFVLGDDSVESHPTDDYFFYYRRLKREFLAFQSRWDPDKRPSPALDRGFGRWSEAAERILLDADHLSQVAGISRGQIERLEAAGVRTFSELATGAVGATGAGISATTLRRLTRQAALQKQSVGRARPLWEHQPPNEKEPRRGLALLPTPSRNDVFFDMEGYPYAEGGLEYLFGAVTVENGKETFHDWWAHDNATEKKAFEDFVDWAYARWEADPAMHIYHYAAYEPAALRRLQDKYRPNANGRDALRALMGKHATRESKVDDMLRGEVFVDLYPIIRQGFVVGTPSYSLKETEKLVAEPRNAAVKTAGGSVVEYQRWIDHEESTDWRESPILDAIREYNKEDCVNTWLLRDWLYARQQETSIRYLTISEAEGKGPERSKREPDEAEVLAAGIMEMLEQNPEGDEDRRRIAELLAHLLGYHRREERPFWWRYFRLTREVDDDVRFEDPNCIAGLKRTTRAPWGVQRSTGYEYQFNPEQDTNIRLKSKVVCSYNEKAKVDVIEFDGERGLIAFKFGPSLAEPPDELSVVEFDFISSEGIVAGIHSFVQSWMREEPTSQAVVDLLERQPPRVTGHTPGTPFIDERGNVTAQAIDVVSRMDHTTLAIQGPPGSGKTYTAARVIAHLLSKGKRVAVTSNGHSVILNLMCAVEKARKEIPFDAPLLKAMGDKAAIPEGSAIKWIKENKEIDAALPEGAVLVGATAWGFCRPELEQEFDYLFVDEAGQVALATIVGIGACASNIVLLGDQMQLAQVTQGVHPPGVEASALTYLLHKHATIPSDQGIFLPITWRMHPRVNQFISDAVYEGRLHAHEHNQRQRVAPCAEPVHCESGIVVLHVPHENNAQASSEEVDQIAVVIDSLKGRRVTDRESSERDLNHVGDLLFVAPYNRQVRALQARLGAGSKVGSVDKFQGQEAPVVVISMSASSLEDAPRGASFLLSPNRLNVAISRAQTLAIVVASPRLIVSRCSTVDEMKLVNLFCRLVDYSEENLSPRATRGEQA